AGARVHGPPAPDGAPTVPPPRMAGRDVRGPGRAGHHRAGAGGNVAADVDPHAGEGADRRDVEPDARGDPGARLAGGAGLSRLRRRTRELPRGDATDLQGRFLPAATQRVSLGDLRGRHLRAGELPLAVLDHLAGLEAREAVRAQGPRVRDLGDRHPDGVPPVLLLFSVCRPLAQSAVLCPRRSGGQHAPIRRYGSGLEVGAGVGAPLVEARRAGGGVTVRVALFAPLLGTGGTQRHLQQVLALLDPNRFHVQVLTLRAGGEVEDELRAGGVSVRSLSVGARLTSPRTMRAIVTTARALRRARVDVVHGYQWRP